MENDPNKESSQSVDLHKQVYTDDLTGLYNRRYLNRRLKEETSLSFQEDKHFGLVMLDLDHFKEVNDQYGHDEGDQALLWVSDILKKSVRSEDIVIRFAGDEFFLILPGATQEESEIVASRIYKSIVDDPFTGSKQQVTVPLGISGGIAIYPNDAKTPEELMKSADNGLYLAKEQGRGRTCLAEDAKKLKEKKFDKALLLNPPFVGRKENLGLIKKCWLDTKDNSQFRFVLVSGEAGIGKTRLVKEFLHDSRINKSGFILSAQVRSQDLPLPYQPIIEIFEVWTQKDPELLKKLIHSLSHREQVELIKLLPHWQEEELSVSEGDPVSANENNLSLLYYGVGYLFKELAKIHPVIIHIEDIQWIDKSSCDLFLHLISQSHGLPLLFLSSYQTFEGKDRHEALEAGTLLRKIRREYLYEDINLSALSDKEIREFIRAVFRVESPLELIGLENFVKTETEGNPFFIKEILLHLLEEKTLELTPKGWRLKHIDNIELPKRVRDILIERLEGFDEDLRQILKVASVLGKEFYFDVLKDISGKNEGYLLDLLDEALDRGVLEEEPDSALETYRFTRNNMQKILYEELSLARVRRYHRLALDSYEKLGQNFVEEQGGVLFAHAYKAKEYKRAYNYGVKAASKAFQSSGNREAKDLYLKVIECHDFLESSVQEEEEKTLEDAKYHLSKCYVLLGQYQEAINILETLGDSTIKKQALGLIYFRLGDYQKSQDFYLQILDQTNDDLIKSGVCSSLTEVLVRQGSYDDAQEKANMAMDLANRSKDSFCLGYAYKVQGVLSFFLGNLLDAFKYYRRSLKCYKNSNNRQGMASCYNNIGLIRYRTQKWDSAESWFLAAKRICSEIGDQSLSMHILNNLGNVYFDQGNLVKAKSSYSRCLQVSLDMGEVAISIASYKNLGNVLAQNDNPEAESTFHKGLSLSQSVGEKSQEAYFHDALGDFYFKGNKTDKAKEFLYKAIEVRHGLNDLEMTLFSLMKLARVVDQSDDQKVFLDIELQIEELFEQFETSGGLSDRIKQKKEEWLKFKKERNC